MPEETAVFYEIRRYQTRPGRRDDWVCYMEDVVLPFQQAKGMTVIGSFVDEQDEDGYVWVRRFDDEKDRVTRYAAVYEDPEWRDRIGPAVDELLLADHSVVTRVRPTAASGLQ